LALPDHLASGAATRRIPGHSAPSGGRWALWRHSAATHGLMITEGFPVSQHGHPL